jgi:PPOX class probable F420-dependent enzyme
VTESDEPRPQARLSERAREFLAPARFATIATLSADGSPHQAVVWYLLRDDSIVVNSLAGRRWPSNLLRDPRFSLVVEDGLDHLAMSGTAELVAEGDEARADIFEMARRYETPSEAERLIRDRFTPQQRLSFRLSIARVHEHWDG